MEGFGAQGSREAFKHPRLRDPECRHPAKGSARSMHDIKGVRGPSEPLCKHVGYPVLPLELLAAGLSVIPK